MGGIPRVTINRTPQRGISTQHNPEFTMLEFYQAYASGEDPMRFSEELLSGLARAR